MTPFSAARSRPLIARRKSSGVEVEPASGVPLRARDTSVFTEERVARLRARLRFADRIRFLADRVLAT